MRPSGWAIRGQLSGIHSAFVFVGLTTFPPERGTSQPTCSNKSSRHQRHVNSSRKSTGYSRPRHRESPPRNRSQWNQDQIDWAVAPVIELGMAMWTSLSWSTRQRKVQFGCDSFQRLKFVLKRVDDSRFDRFLHFHWFVAILLQHEGDFSLENVP